MGIDVVYRDFALTKFGFSAYCRAAGAAENFRRFLECLSYQVDLVQVILSSLPFLGVFASSAFCTSPVACYKML